MEMIFAHSDDLAISILVEWIDIADVLQLDMACAFSEYEKENLHRIFALPQVVFHNAERLYGYFYHHTKGFLNFVVRRKIKLVKIVVVSNTVEDLQLIEEYLVTSGHALRALEFRVYNSIIMSTVCNQCSNIKELSISGAEDMPENSVLFSDSIETFYLDCVVGSMNNNISIKFPNLKDLTIYGSGVSDSVFIGIVQHTTKLLRLKLGEAHSLTNASYTAVGRYCETLGRLSANNMSFFVTHLASILPFTPQLVELKLHRNHGNLITKGVFDAIAANCPNLTELSLEEFDCATESIMLEAFSHMLTRCVHLRTLDMSRCWFVTDDILQAIATHAKRITRLELYDCFVSNDGLAQIGEHCRELEFIGVSVGKKYDATEACELFFRKETTVAIFNIEKMFALLAKIPLRYSNEEVDGIDNDESNESGETGEIA